MRLESALVVRRVQVSVPRARGRCVEADYRSPTQTKGQFNGDVWLGFERLTCVPIQTKMVREVMLSKEERQWLKVRYFSPSLASVTVADTSRVCAR